MHGRADRGRINKDITAEAASRGIAFRQDKSIAIAMHAEPPSNNVLALGRGGDTVFAVLLRQFTPADELFQPFAQIPALLAANSELVNELLEASLLTRLALNVAQNRGVGDGHNGRLLGCHSGPYATSACTLQN